jgi:hypothetical protein
MKKEQVTTCEAFVAIKATVSWPPWTTSSLLVNQPGLKIELAGFTLTQGGLLEELECGARNSTVADFAKAL